MAKRPILSSAFAGEELGKALRVAVGGVEIPRRPESVANPEAALDGALVSLVRNFRTDCRRDMQVRMQGWAMTDAMVADSQWVAWNPNTNRAEPIPPRKGRPRLQLNIIKRWATNIVARFLSIHPQLVVKPGTTDDATVHAASLCTKVIGEHEWHAQNFDRVLSDFLPGFVHHGDGGAKVEWNPKGGRYLGQQPKPLRGPDGKKIQAVGAVQRPDQFTGELIDAIEPLYQEDGVTPQWESERDPVTREPILEDVWEGAIVTIPLDSSEIFFAAGGTDPYKARAVLIDTTQDPNEVFNRYGIEVSADNATLMEGDAWRFNRHAQPLDRPRTVNVSELWIEAGTYRYGSEQNEIITFPKGFVVIVAGDKVLDKGPNHYEHGQIPIIFERALFSPKQMRGDTPANSWREIQTAINKIASAICHNLDLSANNQWIVPTDCNVPEGDKTSAAGAWIRYDVGPNGSKPERVDGQSPAHGFFTLLQLLKNEFGADMAMQHQGGLMGGAPPGIEAGIALEGLAERDTTPLAIMASAIQRFIERWAFLSAMLWKQYKPERQKLTIAGQWNASEMIEFGGIDISDSFEFKVTPASTLPMSKAAGFQRDLLLQEKGYMERRDFLRRQGENDTAEMSRVQMEAANARDENLEAEKSGIVTTPPEAMKLDDPMVHHEEHHRKLLDRKFLRENPRGWLALYQHDLIAHVIPMQEAAMAQAAAQAAMGAPNGSPGGPPPGGGSSAQAPPPSPGEPNLSVERPGIQV